LLQQQAYPIAPELLETFIVDSKTPHVLVAATINLINAEHIRLS
jgi:hypothetical protein